MTPKFDTAIDQFPFEVYLTVDFMSPPTYYLNRRTFFDGLMIFSNVCDDVKCTACEKSLVCLNLKRFLEYFIKIYIYVRCKNKSWYVEIKREVQRYIDYVWCCTG